jgi:HAD superfamily hydrolase (TIGR01509 family)
VSDPGNGHVPEFPVYLFDIDGTLVDSACDICGAVQAVLSSTSRCDVEFEFLRGYIGRHLLDLFRDLEFPADQIEPMIVEYRRIYADRNHTMTKVYAGVPEVLRALGGRKSTATTKGTPTTRIVLERFGLLPFFDHVQGTDGFPAKPEPDVIFRALDGLGASVEDCLFVGDSAADMQAGRRAGVKTAAVTYGYGKREDLARWEPDYWIDDLRQLIRDSNKLPHFAGVADAAK